MKDLENIRLADLMPESIAGDVKVEAAANALDPAMRDVAAGVDLPSLVVNIDSMTSTQLDHMAVMYDLLVWRDHWPVSMKRSVLKEAFLSKRTVGTAAAVRGALRSIGSASQIVEWWQTEPKGVPHTFEIVATLANVEGVLTAEMQEDLQNMIRDTKPARSHFTFTLALTYEGGVGLSGYARALVLSRISDIS